MRNASGETRRGAALPRGSPLALRFCADKHTGMPDELKNLNDRLKWAVWHGDVMECRRLMAAGADAPRGLSACDQAEWFNSAIIAENHKMELVELLLEAGFDPNSVYDRIGEDYQQTPFVAAAGSRWCSSLWSAAHSRIFGHRRNRTVQRRKLRLTRLRAPAPRCRRECECAARGRLDVPVPCALRSDGQSAARTRRRSFPGR